MIFGEIENSDSYYDFYDELRAYVEKHFQHVESGIQGDAYIWIINEDQKVSLDTFSSMRFQIKSNAISSTLLEAVINALRKKYSILLYREPETEGHEDS